MSVWAGSLTLETPGSMHRSEDLDPRREADSEPSVSGWASSMAGGFFRAKDGSSSFPEVPDVSKPEKAGSVWEAYRLMAVPKRKISPSRNGLRFQHKWLKPAFGLIKCKGCGKVTTRHKYCNCGLISLQDAQAAQGESTS
jgi:large subunit ribosomal protein L32